MSDKTLKYFDSTAYIVTPEINDKAGIKIRNKDKNMVWYYITIHTALAGPLMTITGAAVAEWLSSWLAEQEDQGSIPGLSTWIFRDWLSPASKSRYGWKIAKSTLILKTTNQPTHDHNSFMFNRTLVLHNVIFYWTIYNLMSYCHK